MPLPMETLIAKELKENNDFYEKLISHKENWHGGKTFIYNNKNENENTSVNEKYEQYKTVIVKSDELEENYFIYDELITYQSQEKIKNMLVLYLFDYEENKIIRSLIFFNDQEVIQKISFFNYNQLEEIIQKNKLLLEENDTTTIIKTPFLDFLENVKNNEEKKEKAEKKRKLINKYEKKYKKMRVLFWIGIIIFFFLSWGFMPILTNYIIPNLGLGLAATDVTTSIIAGLITGATITGLSFGGYKFKKWLFPKMKEELELKLKNKIKKHDKRIIDKLQRELSLSWTPENKETRIFSAFKEIINKNKNKDFETLSQELNDKFKENKLELEKINYEQNIKKINENKLNLKDNPEHIEKDYRVCSPIKKITLH